MGILESNIESSISTGINNSISADDLQYNIQILTEQGTIAANIKVDVLNVTRDYVRGFGDEIYITFKMEQTDFLKYIWKYRTDLQVDLTIFDGVTSKAISTKRYVMYILSPTNTESNVAANTRQPALNYAEEFLDIQAQLISLFDLTLKGYRTVDNYTTATVGDVILAEFEDAMTNIKFTSGDPKYTINMIPPDNETLYTNIILSPGKEGKLLRLIDLPIKLQNGIYGVYNSDINCYIQHGYLKPTETSNTDRADIFIYPVYRPNVDPSNVGYPYCTILVNHSSIPRIGKEYSYTSDTDGNITMYAMGELKSMDDGGLLQADNVSGYLYLDPALLLGKTGQLDSNGKSLTIQNGLEGTYNIRESFNNISNDVSVGLCSNKCLLAAKGLMTSIGLYEVAINNTTFDRVYPGMPCIIDYETGTGTTSKRIYGTIVQVSYTLFTHNKSLNGKVVVAAGKPSYYTESADS